jgi:hypothetical protein
MQTKEKRTLRYDFSEKEITDLGRELALATSRKVEKEAEKKAVTSQLAADVNLLASQTDNIAQKISNGYEFRSTECVVSYDPDGGTVTVIRSDTDEIIETRPMTEAERQLKIEI